METSVQLRLTLSRRVSLHCVQLEVSSCMLMSSYLLSPLLRLLSVCFSDPPEGRGGGLPPPSSLGKGGKQVFEEKQMKSSGFQGNVKQHGCLMNFPEADVTPEHDARKEKADAEG